MNTTSSIPIRRTCTERLPLQIGVSRRLVPPPLLKGASATVADRIESSTEIITYPCGRRGQPPFSSHNDGFDWITESRKPSIPPGQGRNSYGGPTQPTIAKSPRQHFVPVDPEIGQKHLSLRQRTSFHAGSLDWAAETNFPPVAGTPFNGFFGIRWLGGAPAASLGRQPLSEMGSDPNHLTTDQSRIIYRS